MGTNNDERIENWLDAQMALPAGLHRAYYRRNVNTPTNMQIRSTGPSHPCQETSLWQRAAFSQMDRGKIVEVPGCCSYGELQILQKLTLLIHRRLDITAA